MAMSSSASSVPNLNSMERNSEARLLPATEDEHNGVIVEMHRPIEPQAFSSLLRSSISHWIQSGKRSVWLKLPIENANLVDAAVKEGFYYHHAEPNYLMLARWLPETENMLPANASHRVGVGAFVLNEKKECPQQHNLVDSGYYVLKFIKEIIRRNSVSVPKIWYGKKDSFSENEIDEVRKEWIEYLLELMF